jgi:hypothetical protein
MDVQSMFRSVEFEKEPHRLYATLKKNSLVIVKCGLFFMLCNFIMFYVCAISFYVSCCRI